MPANKTLPAFLAAEGTLDRFLKEFKAGTLAEQVFTHAAHVAMAACYCLRFDEKECVERARRDIRHFNQSVGKKNTAESGYHETITIFWLRTVREFLEKSATGLPRLEAVRSAVLEFASRRDLFQEYYSFDVLKSREARRCWIPPNRQISPNLESPPSPQ